MAVYPPAGQGSCRCFGEQAVPVCSLLGMARTQINGKKMFCSLNADEFFSCTCVCTISDGFLFLKCCLVERREPKIRGAGITSFFHAFSDYLDRKKCSPWRLIQQRFLSEAENRLLTALVSERLDAA